MLSALLFDLDGTLVNTDPVHFLIWQKMLREYGMEIDETFYQAKISGGLNPEILGRILPQLSPDQIQEFAEKKEAIFREIATSLEALPGVMAALNWGRKHNLKLGLVTNAPRANAEFMLQTLKLTDAFDLIVLAEEEAAAKPDPTPYLVALARLGVTADAAITFEDSPSGIRASVAAGIKTVGIASTHNPDKLMNLGTCMAVPDFTDLKVWTFLNSLVDTDLDPQPSLLN